MISYLGIQNQLKAISSVNFPTPRGKAKGEGERDCALQETLVGLAFPQYNASYRVPCQRGGCQWSGSFDGVHRLL